MPINHAFTVPGLQCGSGLSLGRFTRLSICAKYCAFKSSDIQSEQFNAQFKCFFILLDSGAAFVFSVSLGADDLFISRPRSEAPELGTLGGGNGIQVVLLGRFLGGVSHLQADFL
jgi:hypothetical protein